MAQENLFHGEHLPTFPCALRYHQLFQCLLRFTTESATGRGRPAVNRDALLRALIYRALRRFRGTHRFGSSFRAGSGGPLASVCWPVMPVPSLAT